MRSWDVGKAVTLFVLVLAVSMPAAAAAKPGYTVHHPEAWKAFVVRGTHGYTVFAVFKRRQVTIEVVSSDSVVSYTVPAHKRGGRTTARIGKLGWVSMRFRPTGPYSPTTEPQGDCRGRRAQVRHGIFEGRFQWRGEKGFSEARTRRVAGLSLRSYREVCRGETAAIGPDEADKPLLFVRSTAFRDSREVEVYGSYEGSISLVARTVEKRPSLSVERTVFSFLAGGSQVNAEGNQVIVGDYLFRGSAELRSDPNDAERWRGDLEALLPGRGHVLFAGSGFQVEEQHSSPSVRPVGI